MTRWKKRALLFLGSQTVSTFGTKVVQFALVWHIMLKTGSGLATAGTVVTLFLPALIFSPLGGLWADRYNRRVILVCSDTLAAFGALVLAVTFAFHQVTLPLIYAMMCLRSAADAVQGPSVSAILPSLVSKEELIKVNGWSASFNAFTGLVSPVAGGLLVALMPLWAVMLVDVVTAALAIGIFWFFVDVSAYGDGAEDRRQKHPLADLIEGFRYVWSDRVLRSGLLYALINNFMLSSPFTLLGLRTVRVFGGASRELSMISTGMSVGMFCGGLLVSRYKGFDRPVNTFFACGLVLALSMWSAALTPLFPLLVVATFFMGLSFAFVNAPLGTLMMSRCDPAYMGKMSALFSMSMGVVMPSSAALFGALADMVSPVPLMCFIGLVLLTIGAATLVNPHLRPCRLPKGAGVEE